MSRRSSNRFRCRPCISAPLEIGWYLDRRHSLFSGSCPALDLSRLRRHTLCSRQYLLRRPASCEVGEGGLWSGPSTGANLTVALELARRLGPGRRVATTLVDSGLKYLAGDLYT